jgi:signal transduction histidine kinase
MNFNISGSSETTLLEDRFYNTIVFICAINSVLAVLLNEQTHFPLLFNFSLIIIGICYGILYYLGRFKQKATSNKIILLFLFVITLCITWFFNDGYNGSTPFYFFIVTVFIAFLFEKKYAYGIILFQTILIVLLSVIQLNYPQYVLPYISYKARLLDIIFVFVLLVLTLGYIVVVFKRNLDNERSIIKNQKKQIQNQLDELTNLHTILKEINEEIIEKNEELEKTNTILENQKQSIVVKNTELQDLNKTKNKFFSIISHDLKNPFQSILGLSGILVDEIETCSSAEIIEFAQAIRISSQNAYRLLENLLEWSQSQIGTISFNPEVIELQQIINDTLRISASTSQAKKITIRSEIQDSFQFIGDRQMISTILRNLVANAIKYTHRFGEIKLTAIKKDNKVQISVIDNGIGLNAQYIEKLFKINEKTSVPGTENERGTGLGLVLCKEFIDKHGGTIWVESELEKGSTFSFSIPQ